MLAKISALNIVHIYICTMYMYYTYIAYVSDMTVFWHHNNFLICITQYIGAFFIQQESVGGCLTHTVSLTKYLSVYGCMTYLIFVPIGSDQELCCCFGGRVWIWRPHWATLIKHLHKKSRYCKSLPATQTLYTVSVHPTQQAQQYMYLVKTGPIYFIGADINKALQLVLGLMSSSQ